VSQAVAPNASPSTGPPTVRIGTRGSALALWQARHIQHLLGRAFPFHAFEIRVIQSEGDLDKESPLTRIGGRGVFTSALQRALIEGEIDLAVHSAKDVPTLSPEGLAISAFTEREDPRDVLVSRHGVGIDNLPANPVLGTSSQRRAVQVRQLRPDARIVELRGNIDTRLRKAASGDYDAVVLAAAGLIRMGWEDRITEFLPVTRFVPSPGQGVLAIETRTAPDPVAAIVASLTDGRVMVEVSTERAFLRSIGGGCTAPIGAHAHVETAHGREIVRFWGMLGSEDGSRVERVYDEFAPEVAEPAVAAISQTLKRSITPTFTGATPAAENDRVLEGMQVLVTGTTSLAAPVIAGFHEQGATAHHVATISVERSADESLVEQAIADLRRGQYEWLIVTSGNAVDAIARFAPDTGKPWPVRLAAVGRRTADRLREIGFEVSIEPGDQRAEGLIASMATLDVRGQRVLCLFGNRAGAEIPEALRARGAEVETIEAYRTVDATEIDPGIRDLVRAGVVDVVTFASPSSVRAMRHLLGPDLAALSGACLVAIGPTTAAAMADAELPVHATATQPGPSGVVDAVKRYVTGRPASPPRWHP
jgi:hydroxymethylbilane synthase